MLLNTKFTYIIIYDVKMSRRRNEKDIQNIFNIKK